MQLHGLNRQIDVMSGWVGFYINLSIILLQYSFCIIKIFTCKYTVEPLLSGHPRGSALWPLNIGGRQIEVRK
jgi:hypothetical protein